MKNNVKLFQRLFILTLIVFACGESTSSAAEGGFFDIGGFTLPKDGLTADEADSLQGVRDAVAIMTQEKDVRTIISRWNASFVFRRATARSVEEKTNAFVSEKKSFEERAQKNGSLSYRIFRIDRENVVGGVDANFTGICVLKRETFGDLIAFDCKFGCVELELEFDKASSSNVISKITIYTFNSSEILEYNFGVDRAPKRFVVSRVEPSLKFYDIRTRNDINRLAQAARDGALGDRARNLFENAKAIEKRAIRVVEWNEKGDVIRNDNSEGEIERVELVNPPRKSKETTEDEIAALCDDAGDKCKRFLTFGKELGDCDDLAACFAALDENATGLKFNALRFTNSNAIVAFNEEYRASFAFVPNKLNPRDWTNKTVRSMQIDLIGARPSLVANFDEDARFRRIDVLERNTPYDYPVVSPFKIVRRNESDPSVRIYEKESVPESIRDGNPLLEIVFNDSENIEMERRYAPYRDADSKESDLAPIFAFPIVRTSSEGLKPTEKLLLETLASFTQELARGASPEELSSFAGFDFFSNQYLSAYRKRPTRLNFAFLYDDGATEPSEMTIVKDRFAITLSSRGDKFSARVRELYDERDPRFDELLIEFDAKGTPRATSYARPKFLFDEPSPFASILATRLDNSKIDREVARVVCAEFDERLRDYPELYDKFSLNVPRTISVGRKLVWDEKGALVSLNTFDLEEEELPPFRAVKSLLRAPLSGVESYDPSNDDFKPTDEQIAKALPKAPSPRYFPATAREPIFGNFPKITIKSDNIQQEDLDVVKSMIQLANNLREPTTLAALKETFDQFPMREFFQDVDGREKGPTSITISFCGNSAMRPAALIYSSPRATLAFEFEGEFPIASAISKTGTRGFTLMTNRDGALKEFYASQNKKRAIFETASASVSDDATEKTKREIASILNDALQPNVKRERFLGSYSFGKNRRRVRCAVRDVVRHYYWTTINKVCAEFWDRPVLYVPAAGGERDATYIVERPGDKTSYAVSYESRDASEIRRATYQTPGEALYRRLPQE